MFYPGRIVQPASVSEEILWKGSPSQVLNLGKYAFALALVVGIGIGGAFFWPAWIALILPLSTLIIETSDRSQPRIEIKAVHRGDELRETLRKQVEFWRDKKRVREVDFEDGMVADSGDDATGSDTIV